MSQRNLLESIRNALGGTATQQAAELALRAVLQAIHDGLAEDGEVKLSGFGSFKIKNVAARRVILPRSKQSMQLPPRQVLRFIPSAKQQGTTFSEQELK